MMENSSDGEEFAESIGAEGRTSGQSFSVYVPDKDRHGNDLGNQRKWIYVGST